jgi:hypothetical protein
MKVRFQIDKNLLGEEGIAFIGDNNEDLCFIPTRLLYRIDHAYRVLDKFEIGDVLHQIVELYKKDWISTELLNEFTKCIQETSTEIDANVFADTYRAINEFRKIEIIANDFLKDNPSQEFSIANSERYNDWKRRLKKCLNDNYNPDLTNTQ